MSNAAQKIQVTPPPFELGSRKLYYRPHIKWFFYAFLTLSLILEGLTLLGAGIIAIGGRSDTAFTSLITGSILPVFFFLEAWILFRPLAFSFVQIFPDRIELNRISKIIEFKFSEITAVRFSYLPFVGGWFAIVSNGKKPHRFTVVLERSEMILDAIAAARPNLVDQKRLFKYRRTAVYSDHSWARMYRKLKAWPALLFKYLVFPAAIAALLVPFSKIQTPKFMMGLAFFVFGVNLAIGCALYLSEEVIFGRRLSQTLMSSQSSLKRDMDAELVTQRKIRALHYGIVVILALIVVIGKISH